MKKILFVCPSLKAGGAERILSYILRYLDRKKFIPHLALFELKGEFLNNVPNDVNIYDLGKKRKTDFLKLVLSLGFNVFPSCRPDIVVSFLEYANFITVIARMLSRIKPKVIISERGSILMRKKSGKIGIINEYMIKITYPLADKIINVSNGLSKELAERYSVPVKKIHTIYNGVDIEAIESFIKESVDVPELQEKTVPVLISCGRLTYPKNYPLLLRVFAAIIRIKKAYLFLLGEGEERELLEDLIKKLRIQKSVRLLGYKQNPFKYLAKADIFILPSVYEGFPNVILEAFVCGIPVIATRCPHGPDEIIIEGINGILIPPNNERALKNALLRLLDNEKLRKRLSKEGKKKILGFTVEKMVREYEKVFVL